MRHNKLKILVSSYIDGEIGKHEREIVEEHLKRCSECKDFIANSKKIKTCIESIKGFELGNDFVLRVSDLIEKEERDEQKWKIVENIARNSFAIATVCLIFAFILFNYEDLSGTREIDKNSIVRKYISCETKKDSIAIKMFLSENGISKDELMLAIMTK